MPLRCSPHDVQNRVATVCDASRFVSLTKSRHRYEMFVQILAPMSSDIILAKTISFRIDRLTYTLTVGGGAFDVPFHKVFCCPSPTMIGKATDFIIYYLFSILYSFLFLLPFPRLSQASSLPPHLLRGIPLKKRSADCIRLCRRQRQLSLRQNKARGQPLTPWYVDQSPLPQCRRR